MQLNSTAKLQKLHEARCWILHINSHQIMYSWIFLGFVHYLHHRLRRCSDLARRKGGNEWFTSRTLELWPDFNALPVNQKGKLSFATEITSVCNNGITEDDATLSLIYIVVKSMLSFAEASFY